MPENLPSKPASGPANWTDLFDYTHEVIHTGVLRHLLRDRSRGATVASLLLADDVRSIVEPQVEQRIRDSKRVVDLKAVVELASGETICLGVETKVDSNARQNQLDEELKSPDRGVLLAVGLTALNLTAADLAPGLPAWTAVGPARWAEVLKSVNGQEDELIAPYLAQIEVEANQHAAARRHVRGHAVHVPFAGECRTGDRRLEHFAWLCELRDQLEDRASCWVTTERSGPQMAYWSDRLQVAEDEGYDTFLSLMCSDKKRTLCLKLGRVGGDPMQTAKAVFPMLRRFGWRPNDRLRPTKDTCTLGTLDFDELTGPEAGNRMQDAISQLSS